MFYGSINGIDIPNLHLYSFSKLNEETKTLTKNLFGGFAENNDALIIVGENDNQVQVWGYLLIGEINMIHSPYFEYLLNNRAFRPFGIGSSLQKSPSPYASYSAIQSTAAPP